MNGSRYTRSSIRLNHNFATGNKVAVYRKFLRRRDLDNYIWQIEALEGRMAGKVVGMATEVPLVGPIGFLDGSNPAATGRIAPRALHLADAQWHPYIGAWGRRTPTLAILTSDNEIWTVMGERR